jgi:peroxiredoxin
MLRRLTLVIRSDRVVQVFYPVVNPGAHAEEVLDWIRAAFPGPTR